MTATSRRRGVVFATVLWVLTTMTALALALTFAARTQRNYAANAASAIDAAGIEAAAVRYVLQGLTDSQGLPPSETDLPMEGIRVGDGAFWVIAPDIQGQNVMTYGLGDEGGKVDLNTASIETLSKLPEMTSDIAAAIVDWRDSDDIVSTGGAESEYYLRQAEPYEAKNAPFETVQELRMVAGVTDVLLYGEDTNRDGNLEAWENDGDDSPPADNRDGKLDRGLAGLTTAFLRWPQTSSSAGDQHVNPNTASRDQLQQALAPAVGAGRAEALADSIFTNRPYSSIFDLYYRCALQYDEFPEVEDLLVFSLPPQAFRVNINAAPAEVLACLPGLSEVDAAALVQARVAGASGQSLAWAIDALPQEKLIAAFANDIVARSYQYTADIVTIAGNGRSFRRCQVVIDVSGSTPRVVYRQDLTAWGWLLDEKIRRQLAAGVSLDDVLAASGTKGS